MSDDGLSLDFLLILVPAVFAGKVLVALGVLTHQNALPVSRWAAVVVGIGYALWFTPVRDFGFPLGSRILMGCFVGCVLWFPLWFGFVWALVRAEK